LTLPAEYAGLLSQKRDHRRFPYLGTLWYELNTRRPPLDDVRVRRALHLAVDRDELVATVLRGTPIAATHYVPDYVGGGYAEQAAREREAGVDPFSAPGASFDPDRARALLALAGYPVAREGDRLHARGFPPLEILYNVAEEHRKVAVAIQDMWKRHLGVSVTLRAEEWKVMLKTIRDGHFQIARLGWIAEYNHPHTWLSSFLSNTPQNPTGFRDPELDALVEAAARAGDPAEGIRRYREAERRALDVMVRIPLYFRSRDTLVKPWVKGFYTTPRDIHLARWLWIDPAWRDDPSNDLAAAPLELPPPGRIEGASAGVAP
jgi:oligopeptide transport system substrate-binding protein